MITPGLQNWFWLRGLDNQLLGVFYFQNLQVYRGILDTPCKALRAKIELTPRIHGCNFCSSPLFSVDPLFLLSLKFPREKSLVWRQVAKILPKSILWGFYYERLGLIEFAEDVLQWRKGVDIFIEDLEMSSSRGVSLLEAGLEDISLNLLTKSG